ncbi:MAG: hypothetical protein ACQEUT_04710 [Bacillota bacterium]
MNKIHKLFFILSCLFLLTSCTGNAPENSKPEEQSVPEKKPETDQQEVAERELVPLVMKENSFQRVLDWIDSDRILVLSKSDNENQLIDYNIFTGEKNVLYKDEEFIVDAKLSPDRQSVLIHSSPLTYSASMTIINLTGDVLFEKDIDSYEIVYDWNDHNTDLIFITSFAEDWTFETKLADISEETVTEVKSSQPFIKWHTEDSFLFQDWPEESISLAAPLYSRSLNTEEIVLVEEQIVHFETFGSYILSISMDAETEGKAMYKFITEEGAIVSTTSQPLLSSYSNWVIPYYDKIDSKESFVSLTAAESLPQDTYKGTFTLEEWNIKTGQREEILSGLPNAPLECSPDGSYCLTGYELKLAVDMNSKEKAEVIILE